MAIEEDELKKLIRKENEAMLEDLDKRFRAILREIRNSKIDYNKMGEAIKGCINCQEIGKSIAENIKIPEVDYNKIIEAVKPKEEKKESIEIPKEVEIPVDKFLEHVAECEDCKKLTFDKIKDYTLNRIKEEYVCKDCGKNEFILKSEYKPPEKPKEVSWL